MAAILIFPGYLIVLVLLWMSYSRQLAAARTRPSHLVPFAGAVLGAVVGYLAFQNVNFGVADVESFGSIAVVVISAPLAAVISGKIALWLMERTAR